MAKVQFGILASEIRAKIGGVVYTRVRGTAVVRVKVIPRNPKTTAQTTIRTAFSAVGKAWFQTLTEDQRQTWISFANTFPVRDRLGQTIFLTGHMWFMRQNRPRQVLGIGIDTLPPSSPHVEELDSITVFTNSISTGTLTVRLTPNPATTAQIFFWATTPLSAGRNNFAPFLRVIQTMTRMSSNVYELFPAYQRKFGTPTAGKAIGIQAHLFDVNTNTRSIGVTTKVILGA